MWLCHHLKMCGLMEIQVKEQNLDCATPPIQMREPLSGRVEAIWDAREEKQETVGILYFIWASWCCDKKIWDYQVICLIHNFRGCRAWLPGLITSHTQCGSRWRGLLTSGWFKNMKVGQRPQCFLQGHTPVTSFSSIRSLSSKDSSTFQWCHRLATNPSAYESLGNV